MKNAAEHNVVESNIANILVVDDLDANLFAMQRMIEPLGVTITSASSAAEGLRVLLNQHIDVLVLDYSMPGINGLEMAKLVNKQFREPPPILFVTAHGQNVPGLEAACYELGAMDFIEKPVREEVLLSKLKVLITLTQQRETMRTLAKIDPVTKIKNRLAFQDALKQNLSLAVRQERMMAVIALDLDDFKGVNDHYGHAAGDALLRGFAERLCLAVRDSDTVARVGGDEFVIMLTNINSSDDVALVANKVLRACEQAVKYEGLAIPIKTSIGCAMYPHHGDSGAKLMKAADVALYQAKLGGKGRFVILQEGHSKISSTTDMQDLMALYYQPLFAPGSKQPVGVEVLSRIDESEKFGGTENIIRHMRQIGNGSIFESTLQNMIRDDFDTLNPPSLDSQFYLFLNESLPELKSQSYVEHLVALQRDLAKQHICLVLDLTDWKNLAKPESILKSLQPLRRQGVKLCLQGVGELDIPVGLISTLSIDFVKISIPIVASITKSDQSKGTVKAIAVLAKSLDFATIALGVETAEQYQELKLLACDYFQGSYWSLPITLNDLQRRWLDQSRIDLN